VRAKRVWKGSVLSRFRDPVRVSRGFVVARVNGSPHVCGRDGVAPGKQIWKWYIEASP